MDFPFNLTKSKIIKAQIKLDCHVAYSCFAAIINTNTRTTHTARPNLLLLLRLIIMNEANKKHDTWEISAHYTHCFAHINTIITNTNAL